MTLTPPELNRALSTSLDLSLTNYLLVAVVVSAPFLLHRAAQLQPEGSCG